MSGLLITDAAKQFGVTSKTLRYYEKVGLLATTRAENNYRYYTKQEVERIQQIMILRKMQIPIKDIIRIYQSQDMSVVVETFVNRLQIIDSEINALAELRNVVNNFLQAMIKKGVTKISALPILYEKFESYEKMELLKPIDVSIINLPTMRVLSSRLKENLQVSDSNGFWRWVQANGLPLGEPGRHEHFEYQTAGNDMTILRIAGNFTNDSPYVDYLFNGGLFAVANFYLDDDVNERFHSIISAFDENKFYEIDYKHNGELRHEALIEMLISPDDKRELVSMFVPVKKRFADAGHFENGERIDVPLQEIEQQNPVLWAKEVNIMSLTPRENSKLTLLENGEINFLQWLWPGVLPTEISVQIPFRVDVEFRASLNSLYITHGKAMLKANGGYRNDHANHRHSLTLRQPVFGDEHTVDYIGLTDPQNINTLSWIVGEKYIVCILNGEVKLCFANAPYMRLNSKVHTPQEITIGSDQDHYHDNLVLKNIKISQLAQSKKNKLKKGDLTMITRQSNNILPDLHQLITWHYGENYVINGCMRLLMERVQPDEPINTNYNLFAAITGDNEVQAYGRGFKRSYNQHDLPLSSVWDGQDLIAYLFDELGYEHSYVTAAQIRENKGMYVETVKAYIDKGIPVLARTTSPQGYGSNYELIVGYEESGKVLLYLDGDDIEPRKEVVGEPRGKEWQIEWDWIFIGDKKRDIDKKTLYTNCLKRTLEMLTSPDKYGCSYGAKAFRDWADDIENGFFVNGGEYTAYVCVLATNGGRGFGYIYEQMPEFGFLKDILDNQCKRNNELWDELEKLGGGFNVTNEVMQDAAKRKQIANKIREFAVCKDEIVQILQKML